MKQVHKRRPGLSLKVYYAHPLPLRPTANREGRGQTVESYNEALNRLREALANMSQA